MRGGKAMAAGAAAALAAHAVPLVTTRASLRRRYLPRLAGLGRPDHVALTFDDGPDPGTTPYFLDELDRLGMRATFFMLGVNADLHRTIAAEVAAAGHEVAAHGYHHRSQLFSPPGRVRDDILHGIHTVAEATGEMPRWYRPPFGTLSNAGLLAAQRFGLRTVLWSAWGKDWSEKATAATVLAELDKDLGPGVTVLLHDSDCASAPGSWKAALGALEGLAERLAAAGLTAGPLADHGIAD
ncbi:MAG: polysaccharide deacetylase family protein [Acidimicrobiia bacterium]|nr:polysaccharide deacetylase family protein [Acidimicrobiia bacterium]